MNAKVSRRSSRGVRWAAVASGLLALFLMVPANAVELLEVKLGPWDEETNTGQLVVHVRDATDKVPTVSMDELPVEITEVSRVSTTAWHPLLLVVDTANIEEQRLEQVKQYVLQIARRELEGGARKVVVANQGGMGEGSSVQSLEKIIQPTVESWVVEPQQDPKGRKPTYSTLSTHMGKLLSSVGGSKNRPWALIFSSLCFSPEDKPPEALKGFRGPIRIVTWEAGVHEKCKEPRDAWLAAAREMHEIEVLDRDDPARGEALKAALKTRGPSTDQELILGGVPYKGGVLKLQVALEGVEKPWSNTFGAPSEEAKATEVDPIWGDAATRMEQAKVRFWAAVSFGVLVLLLIVFAVLKARAGGQDVQRWTQVGEAEDLKTPDMDPDAWNATIFQLTGAMPALKEVRQAAQLGPADAVPARTGKPAEEPAPEGAGDTSSSPAVQPASDLPSTGMTVDMPVLDDGTGYDADIPFEIGVLLNGKPVARKTKKFRKVFSIGRATDNRVVIQKDDTVHRYHVVIRPAVEGKEWWLEVSPTSTNRTNLNGKDLRPGGRYRLPARFRLQLGEATEVRGRLSKDA